MCIYVYTYVYISLDPQPSTLDPKTWAMNSLHCWAEDPPSGAHRGGGGGQGWSRRWGVQLDSDVDERLQPGQLAPLLALGARHLLNAPPIQRPPAFRELLRSDCLMLCDCLVDCLETFKLLGYARRRQSRPHFGLGFRVKVRFSLSAHVVSSTLLRFDCCQLFESSSGLFFTWKSR